MANYNELFDEKAKQLGDAARAAAAQTAREQAAAQQADNERRTRDREAQEKAQRLLEAKVNLNSWVDATIIPEAVHALLVYLNTNGQSAENKWTVIGLDGSTTYEVSEVVGHDDEYSIFGMVTHSGRYKGFLLQKSEVLDVVRQPRKKIYRGENLFVGSIRKDTGSGAISPSNYIDLGYSFEPELDLERSDPAGLMSRIIARGKNTDIQIFDNKQFSDIEDLNRLSWGMSDSKSDIYKDTAQSFGRGLAGFAAKNIMDFPKL